MVLTADDYEQRLRHYRQQNSGELVASGFFGKWARDAGLERQFQRELKAEGIEWERRKVAQSAARAGSIQTLFCKEQLMRSN
jgi:hypothetical protein